MVSVRTFLIGVFMRYATVVGFFCIALLAGCTSLSVIPQPVAGGIVNPADQSIRINKSGLSISARVQDVAVGGYDIDTAIGSFYLTIKNNTGAAINVDLDAFELIDSSTEKHQPLEPEEVNALINPGISYLLPYPFIGFYDVVDLEQYRASSAMSSERPYVGEGLSAVEKLIPLKTGVLKSGQQATGMLYFNVEITDQTNIQLKATLPAGESAENRIYVFPFSIER